MCSENYQNVCPQHGTTNDANDVFLSAPESVCSRKLNFSFFRGGNLLLKYLPHLNNKHVIYMDKVKRFVLIMSIVL